MPLTLDDRKIKMMTLQKMSAAQMTGIVASRRRDGKALTIHDVAFETPRRHSGESSLEETDEGGDISD